MAVSAAAAGAAPGSDWLAQDERRMLHAVYRVGDMDATIAFYKDCLGMQLLRYRDIPEVGRGAGGAGWWLGGGACCSGGSLAWLGLHYP